MVIFRNIDANPDEKFDINFQTSPDANLEVELTGINKELYKDIEYLNNINKSLKHTKDEVKEKYFKKLLSLAQAGFLSSSPNPIIAQLSLEVLQKEMLLVEGHRIKNRYMFWLGVGAIVSIAVCWIVYCVVSIFYEASSLEKYFFTWTGAMVGTWISFGARKFTIQLEDLSVLEKDNMNIYIRLPYIGICSLIFLLFLDSEILSFKIGSMSSEKINNTIEFQILIGIVAGLLESKLGVKIYEKVQDITKDA